MAQLLHEVGCPGVRWPVTTLKHLPVDHPMTFAVIFMVISMVCLFSIVISMVCLFSMVISMVHGDLNGDFIGGEGKNPPKNTNFRGPLHTLW